MRELEQKLGQALVEKGGGRVELTPFGEHCLPLFRGLIEHHDRIAREATLLARHEIGQVSIATVPSVASRLLPGPLARFVAEHPNVQVSIQDGTAESVQQLLTKGQVDFGISSLWMEDEQIEFMPIAHDRGRGVPGRSSTGASGRGLALVAAAGPADDRQRHLAATGRHGCSVFAGAQAVVRLQHDFVDRDVGRRGRDQYPAVPGVSAGKRKLAFLPLAAPKVERQIGMLTRKGRSLSPAAGALMAFLQAQWPSAE